MSVQLKEQAVSRLEVNLDISAVECVNFATSVAFHALRKLGNVLCFFGSAGSVGAIPKEQRS